MSDVVNSAFLEAKDLIMPRRPSSQPTEVELEILQVLWEHGPCPLGRIHEALSEYRDTAYTTTQKMVRVMRDKGLVNSDDSVRPQIYSAAISQEQTQVQMLDDLAQRLFGGSAQKLVMSLLSTKRMSPKELQEIQGLIRKAKGGT